MRGSSAVALGDLADQCALIRVMPVIVGGGGPAYHRYRVRPEVPPLEALRAQRMRASGDD